MVWYLLICIRGYHEVSCQPIQYMTNYDECQFVYRQYRELAKAQWFGLSGRCFQLNRLQGR